MKQMHMFLFILTMVLGIAFQAQAAQGNKINLNAIFAETQTQSEKPEASFVNFGDTQEFEQWKIRAIGLGKGSPDEKGELEWYVEFKVDNLSEEKEVLRLITTGLPPVIVSQSVRVFQ